jgi:predicted ATP-dependent endonuclease of OLD family
MTLLLFEEPEAYLHPNQQMILFQSLKAISLQEGNLVVVSTHSPQFVSFNSDDLTSLIRLSRQSGKTIIGQLDSVKLDEIFNENQRINEILKDTKDAPHIDDWKTDMEAVKYFLWLSPERCEMFFAEHVLLVEGTTERVLFSHLIKTGKVPVPKGGVFVLDCMGKYNIHRFMNLLGALGIGHSVLFDEDSCKGCHEALNKLVSDSGNTFTRKIETMTNDIESFLDISKAGEAHRKPQHVMLKLKEGAIAEERMTDLLGRISALINL